MSVVCEPPAVGPLVALLRQLCDLVESLSADEYARKPVGVVASSVGGHVRHNLDHVDALLRGLRSGALSYDHRDRGTNVERDPRAAASEIRRLVQELTAIAWEHLPPTLCLTTLVAADRPPVTALTSPERELAFVVSHTVHHNAIIGIMATVLGAEVPAEFGYAPSTLQHLRSRACVP